MHVLVAGWKAALKGLVLLMACRAVSTEGWTLGAVGWRSRNGFEIAFASASDRGRCVLGTPLVLSLMCVLILVPVCCIRLIPFQTGHLLERSEWSPVEKNRVTSRCNELRLVATTQTLTSL